MSTMKHYSVLLEESIALLNIHPDGIYVDATLGRGGHSVEILKHLQGKGFLYAFDQDEEAIVGSQPHLYAIGSNFECIKSNFVHLKEELYRRGVMKIDGILFDLGVSSPQLDDASRGFSYHQDAPLDMRMDRDQNLTAYEVVNTYPYEDLYRIIRDYGEERYARPIARAIVEARKKKPIQTTLQLVEVIKGAMPEKAKRGKHPARRTFQAIRIEVNRELDVLPQALMDAIDLLKVGGRLAIITFHSLEDRIVARILKELSRSNVPSDLPAIPEMMKPILELYPRKPIMASAEELEVNRRSRSARLRGAIKLRERTK